MISDDVLRRRIGNWPEIGSTYENLTVTDYVRVNNLNKLEITCNCKTVFNIRLFEWKDKLISACVNCTKYNTGCYRTYHFNTSALNIIDTVDKAYFLGWIATDGSVRKDGVVLNLNYMDDYILKNIFEPVFGKNISPIKYKQQSLSITKNGNVINSSSTAYRKLCSIEVADDLRSHLKLSASITKTWSVRFPTLDNDDLRWAFMRGVIEGDGSISDPFSKYMIKFPAGSQLRIKIASVAMNFMMDIQEFLKTQNIKSAIIPAIGLHIHSMDSFKVISKIYPPECSINQVLVRKYRHAMEWLRRRNRINELMNMMGRNHAIAKFYDELISEYPEIYKVKS